MYTAVWNAFEYVLTTHFTPKVLTTHFTDWVYTAVWNALELPVTQVPIGEREAGGGGESALLETV